MALRAALLSVSTLCGVRLLWAGEAQPDPLPCHESPLCYTASSSELERNHLVLYDIDIVDTTRGVSRIKADRAEATGRDFGNANWVLTGHVQVFIPEGQLRADTATVQFTDNHIETMTADGTPAEFEHALDNGQIAHGHARAITFDMRRNELQLNGDSWLSDGCNEINSGHIAYDIGSQRMRADSSPGDSAPVHGTIRNGATSQCAAPGGRP
jgi:lipopolysaccharide transport protein LptA